MADNDMMIVPGFGQMTRAQVETEKAAAYHTLKSDPGEFVKRNTQDKLAALKKARPIGAKKSIRLI